MKERNTLKEEATKSGDKDLLNEYKIIRNKVRHAISKDQSDYYKQKFLDENMSLKQSWNVVNNFLDDYLPVTSVDAIGVMQNFDLLNIRNPYRK